MKLHIALASAAVVLFCGSSTSPVVVESAVAAASTHHGHRSLSSQVVQDFQPLVCGQPMETTCVPWTSSVTSMTGGNGWVTIPCHKCVQMDKTDGSIVTIAGGLQIQGKLVFPNEARVKVQTKLIVVEGTLEMTSNDVVGAQPKVSIEMVDDANVNSFTPHSSNANACGGSACVVGKQAIVVAGGKLDIQGLPPDCPSWSTIASTVSGPMPIPTQHVLVAPSGASGEGCDPNGMILNNFFSDGSFDGWHGNLGTTRTVTNANSFDGTSNYLRIGNRKMTWQGPYYELPLSKRNCLTANQSYHFSAQLRLNRGTSGIPSLCSTMGTNCPRLRLTYMDSSENLWWDTKIQPVGMNTVDGTWFTMVGDVTLTSAQIASSNIYIALTVDNVEKGIDISMGGIELKLPQVELPALETSCDELIFNGDGSKAAGTVFPMTSFVKNEATLSLKKDENSENSYFHLAGRTAAYSSLTTQLNPQCTVDKAYYNFFTKLRVNSNVAVTVKMLLRRTDTAGNAVHDQIAICDASTSTWVNCAAEVQFTSDHKNAAKLELLFVTVGDSTSTVDYDDLSLKFKSAGDAVPVLQEPNVGACWGQGSKMLITSDSRLYDGAIVRTISNVNAEQNSVASSESVRTWVSRDPNAE